MKYNKKKTLPPSLRGTYSYHCSFLSMRVFHSCNNVIYTTLCPLFGLTLRHKHFSYYYAPLQTCIISGAKQCFTGCMYCLIILLRWNLIPCSVPGSFFLFSFLLLYLSLFFLLPSVPPFLPPFLPPFFRKFSNVKFLLETQGLGTALSSAYRTLLSDLQRKTLGEMTDGVTHLFIYCLPWCCWDRAPCLPCSALNL